MRKNSEASRRAENEKKKNQLKKKNNVAFVTRIYYRLLSSKKKSVECATSANKKYELFFDSPFLFFTVSKKLVSLCCCGWGIVLQSRVCVCVV